LTLGGEKARMNVIKRDFVHPWGGHGGGQGIGFQRIMANIKDIKERAKNVLQEEEDVLFCYLFGSVAEGRENKESDLDIGVYISPETKEDFFEVRLRLIEKFTRELSKQADVVILNTASPFLRYVVIKEGELLVEKSREKRIDFELAAMRDYFDYKPTLDFYNKIATEK